MTVIFENQTTDSAGTTPVVVSADTIYQLTVSGEFGSDLGPAEVAVVVVQDSLRPAPVKVFTEPGTVILDLKAGSSWYLTVDNTSNTTDIDASYV